MKNNFFSYYIFSYDWRLRSDTQREIQRSLLEAMSRTRLRRPKKYKKYENDYEDLFFFNKISSLLILVYICQSFTLSSCLPKTFFPNTFFKILTYVDIVLTQTMFEHKTKVQRAYLEWLRVYFDYFYGCIGSTCLFVV